MIRRALPVDPDLYDSDETAWLEAMAALAREGRALDLDLPHLAEYLQDMARRDRREVLSRLVVLIAHRLKWDHQPEHRSASGRATIEVQRQELAELLESGTLRNHAGAVREKAYANAIRQVVAETGLVPDHFPASCPYPVEELLSDESRP